MWTNVRGGDYSSEPMAKAEMAIKFVQSNLAHYGASQPQKQSSVKDITVDTTES